MSTRWVRDAASRIGGVLPELFSEMMQPANVAWVERHGSGMDNWMLLESLHLSGVNFGEAYPV